MYLLLMYLAYSDNLGQHDWTGSLSPWISHTPPGMPIWQYTTAALNDQEPSIPYYSHSSPITPYLNGPSGSSSAVPSPNLPIFPRDTRYPHLTTPGYEPQVHDSNKLSRNSPPGIAESIDNDETMEDEDSDTISWGPNSVGPKSSTPKRPPHRRTQSNSEVSMRNAKRAHTAVEKNYRERLNDKIADLAVYLFETSSDCKPILAICNREVCFL